MSTPSRQTATTERLAVVEERAAVTEENLQRAIDEAFVKGREDVLRSNADLLRIALDPKTRTAVVSGAMACRLFPALTAPQITQQSRDSASAMQIDADVLEQLAKALPEYRGGPA